MRARLSIMALGPFRAQRIDFKVDDDINLVLVFREKELKDISVFQVNDIIEKTFPDSKAQRPIWHQHFQGWAEQSLRYPLFQESTKHKRRTP